MEGIGEVFTVRKWGVGWSASTGEPLQILVFGYGTYVEIVKFC
jgi:hypothetical protein